MNLDLKVVLKSGIIWGIVAIILVVIIHFLGRFLPAGVQGLTLGTYAVLFAGVQFAYQEKAGWIMPLIGGALAGVVAALLLVVASMIIPGLGLSFGAGLHALIPPLIAGICGALGMEIVKRVAGRVA
jgi:hypothetical protein